MKRFFPMLQSLSAKAARMAFVRRAWTALPLLLWTLCVRAATGQSYYFKTLDVGDGLSQNTVGQIIQDRLGFMWFGTREGLNRYDGLAFRVYRKDNSGLGKNFVTALYEDSGGGASGPARTEGCMSTAPARTRLPLSTS